MTAHETVAFSAGNMDLGVQIRTSDFYPSLVLDKDSYNVTQGIYQGLGPRFGMSPIPGQSDGQTPTGSRLPGLRYAETTNAIGLQKRLGVFGIVPISLPDPTDVTKKITAYAFVVTAYPGGLDRLFDILITSTGASSGVSSPPTVETISANIWEGFGISSYLQTISYVSAIGYPYLADVIGGNQQDGSKQSNLTQALLSPSFNAFMSIATISVVGPDIPNKWIAGLATATGDATHAPSVGYDQMALRVINGGAADRACFGGVPSEYNLKNFKTTPRNIKVFALTNKGAFNINYDVNFTPSLTNMLSTWDYSTTTNLDLSAITATKSTAGTTYSATINALVNDEQGICNSSYKAIFAAGEKPFACLFQDAWRNKTSLRYNQYCDLTNMNYQPQPIPAARYFESGSIASTCFVVWPEYVPGTAMSGFAGGPSFTGANTGILRKSTTYEFTFSIYNKKLNYESNVGKGVKFETDHTNDFTALQIFVSGTGDALTTAFETMQDALDYIVVAMPFLGYSGSGNDYNRFTTGVAADNINHLEFRFYYRQLGTYQWLNAGNIDMAQYWFQPGLNFTVCQGSGSTIGGQVGNPATTYDYSMLPQDSYNCVVSYKNRAWWFSEKAAYFSLPNNPLAYPAGNSISIPSAKIKGAIVHNYPGQAEQSSRLIIFTDKTIYVARFTGNRTQTQIVLSDVAVSTVDIDGSDLEIDSWTSVTAFSYRAAAVADGILYYWGPQGIYRDDGVNTPTKISLILEPWIFTAYDPNATDQTHSVYDPHTKEITWFYTPKTFAGGDTTKAIIYNTTNQTFLFAQYPAQIDWAQQLNVTTNAATSGNRTVIGQTVVNGTVQRACYYDQVGRAGDIPANTEMMIKTVSSPTAATRRLTLAANYYATNFATIAVGDIITIQQANAYSGQTIDDMLATVTAINTGAGTIDILVPTGATFASSATLTYDKFFPIWQSTPTGRGLNGIPWQIKTAYWMPQGVNGYYFWLYTYLLSRLRLWKSNTDLTISFGYRSCTALGFQTDTLTLTDNADGNCQIFHLNTTGDDAMEGQALRYLFSGIHRGHEWLLQYLEAQNRPIAGNVLARFEG